MFDTIETFTPAGLTNTSFFFELQQALPIAYSLFDSEDPNEFQVFLGDHIRDFMHDVDLKDKPILFKGLSPYIPPIHFYIDTDTIGKFICHGVTLYETRKQNIKYAVISTTILNNPHNWIVVKKNEADKLFKYFNGQRKAAIVLASQPPVLKEGMMDNILLNSVTFLENHAKFAHYGVRLARGLVLQGVPGNGKTMACKWITEKCREKGFTTDIVTSQDIEESYKYNELPQLVNSANIVFFDDVDISFLSRRKNGSSINDSRLACALLSAMDGIGEISNGVVRIFTTNEKVVDIEEAFLRPGRIDKVFTFENPDKNLRVQFINTFWHEDIKNNIDIDKLCNETDGKSFAEIDEIKTLLVQRFLNDGTWDLEHALLELKNRKHATAEMSKLLKIKKKVKKKSKKK